jgi:Cu/Ag efflux protein CusF
MAKGGFMIKKAVVLAILLVFCASSFVMAADDAKKAQTPVVNKAVPVMAGNPARPMQTPRPEFSMITGKVEKIDSSDPANTKITVKNDKDGTSRTLVVMPWTNITKSAEISELKTGETVRVMARKADDKEIAMGIMFGKINMPPPRQVPPPVQAAQAKTQVKK